MERRQLDYQKVPIERIQVAIDVGRIATLVGFQDVDELLLPICREEAATDLEIIGGVIGITALKPPDIELSNPIDNIQTYLNIKGHPTVNEILHQYIDKDNQRNEARINRIRSFLNTPSNSQEVAELSDEIVAIIGTSLEVVVQSEIHRFPGKSQQTIVNRARTMLRIFDGETVQTISSSNNVAPYRLRTELDAFERMFHRAFPEISELLEVSFAINHEKEKFERFDTLFSRFYSKAQIKSLSNEEKSGILLRLPSLVDIQFTKFPKKMQSKLSRHVHGLITYVESGSLKEISEEYQIKIKSMERRIRSFVRQLYKLYPDVSLLIDQCHESYLQDTVTISYNNNSHQATIHTDSEFGLSQSKINPGIARSKPRFNGNLSIIEQIKLGGIFRHEITKQNTTLLNIHKRLMHSSELVDEETEILSLVYSGEDSELLSVEQQAILHSALEKCSSTLRRWGYDISDPHSLIGKKPFVK